MGMLAGIKPLDGPEGAIALSALPPSIPPQYWGSSMSSPNEIPIGTSNTPERLTSPLTERNRLPLNENDGGPSLRQPLAAYLAPPLSTMNGAQARVSTLLTAVGLSRKPLLASSGGRFRGWARRSSIASINADCSPQM